MKPLKGFTLPTVSNRENSTMRSPRGSLSAASDPVEEAGAHVHRVRTGAEFYAEAVHDFAAYSVNAAIAASAACSIERSEVSMVIGARA